MDIVFCADRGVLPGLHVAMYSLLTRLNSRVAKPHFTIFSDALNETDVSLLKKTLEATSKNFSLALRKLDPLAFQGFPPLNGSYAAYYRLFAAQAMTADRFLYVDADTLCDLDVSDLWSVEMRDRPLGWVPEAPMPHAVDRAVAEELGNNPRENYFNSGVLLVNQPEWQRQKVTEKCMEYINAKHPAYHDQSALNVVLHSNAIVLDAKYNCITNMRKNWPVLRRPYGQINRLLHFVDYPKPWDLGAECLHPQYRLWRTILDQTAMKIYRSWHATPARKIPRNRKAWLGYKKTAKDRLLFAGYSQGWLKSVKGVS